MAEPTVGVDIGSTAIRAVRVKHGKKPTIVRAGQIGLPAGIISDGKVIDSLGLAQALRILWREYKIGTKKVVVGLTGQHTLVRQVELPWEPPAIFKASLPLRVGKDLPIDPTEMVLDYHPQDESILRGSVKQKALVVGTTRVDMENMFEAFKEAGLTIVKADYAPFALIRLASALDPQPLDPPGDGDYQCDVIVDLGEYSTNVVIHKQGYPLFVRPLPTGSGAVTRALADQLRVTLRAGELVKKTLGLGQIELTEEDYEVGAELPEDAAEYGQEIINQMGGQLVQEVRETVDYYLNAAPHVTGVRSIKLTGRGSLLGGYKDRLQAELQAPADYLNPLEEFGVKNIFRNVDIADPAFGSAFGLVAGNVLPKVKGAKAAKKAKEREIAAAAKEAKEASAAPEPKKKRLSRGKKDSKNVEQVSQAAPPSPAAQRRTQQPQPVQQQQSPQPTQPQQTQPAPPVQQQQQSPQQPAQPVQPVQPTAGSQSQPVKPTRPGGNRG